MGTTPLKKTYDYYTPLTPWVQSFTYKGQKCEIIYGRKAEDKPVFEAVLSSDCNEVDGKEVYIKFARTYSEDAHKYFYSKGAAPQLYYCEKLAIHKKYFVLFFLIEKVHLSWLSWRKLR